MLKFPKFSNEVKKLFLLLLLVAFFVPTVSSASPKSTYTSFFCRYFNVVLIPFGVCVIDTPLPNILPQHDPVLKTSNNIIDTIAPPVSTTTITADLVKEIIITKPTVINRYVTYQTNTPISDEELNKRIAELIYNLQPSTIQIVDKV